MISGYAQDCDDTESRGEGRKRDEEGCERKRVAKLLERGRAPSDTYSRQLSLVARPPFCCFASARTAPLSFVSRRLAVPSDSLSVVCVHVLTPFTLRPWSRTAAAPRMTGPRFFARSLRFGTPCLLGPRRV